jgi:hypothetical protein
MTESNLPGRTDWESQQYRADGGMHARLAQGLRDAAHYVETHPDIPIPASVEINYHIPADTDQAGQDELSRIATMLGAPVTGEAVGYTGKDFGPVRYSADYITRRYSTEYTAHMATFHAEQAASRVTAIKDAARETNAAITGRSAAA